jgi:hypothetical protein
MIGPIEQIGDSAAGAWATRDAALSATLEQAATSIGNLQAAVDASGLFPDMSEAVGEALVQLEHGSVALLMGLTSLAADAARRTLEVVYFTAFLRHGPLKQKKRMITSSDWHSGAALYSFVVPLRDYFSDPSRKHADTGIFSAAATTALYADVSGAVHANPLVWGESRDGLLVKADAAGLARRADELLGAARAAAYVVLLELPDLSVDDIELLFSGDWPAVRAILGLP